MQRKGFKVISVWDRYFQNDGLDRFILISIYSDDSIVISDVFSYDRELSDQVFKKEGSMKKVVYLLNDGVFLPGFNTLESSARRMLDYIFNTGGVYRTLDIYCTHDFHIALLLTALWKNNVTLKSIEENWPNMLEGLFIWGERNDFYCSWRYMKGHFVNFMN